MTLPDTLLIEQPWGAGRHLFGTRYRIDVYTEHGAQVAQVTDRGLLGPLRKALRATGFSGRTTFDLVVTQGRQPILRIRKGPGRPPTTVSYPDGRPIGSLRKEGRAHYALLDAAGQRLCHFGDVVGFSTGSITKRDGRRVRQDLLRVRPGVPEPVRTLAIATALAFDVVRGTGTAHTSGGVLDFPA
ncbi:hypothetical protein GCM10022243_52330 [Saccharothrix violaceirubra]|uniref:Uncharacterized protein n=1 Tax=Saccharothrix violaceirubra TaxID=413306 RepID=A0A7W7X033_9PSEU|nr:hypothetical protein [Saccharothrix violaceirubra]MBB4969466.1 hypothetical protein [Saccharothrix violaceirubra]